MKSPVQLSIWNTLNRRVEPALPAKKREVYFYTCGPTVYDSAHIGNLRSYIFADLLYRTIRYDGYRTKWIMNITDVDDKTIKRTVEKKGRSANITDLRKYTDYYLKLFHKDLDQLNISRKNLKFVRVSDKIKEIVRFIKKLLMLGYAYKAGDGSIYFSIEKYQKKFGDYGRLVGGKFLEGKKIGATVRVDEYDKDNLSDFALWKAPQDNDARVFWRDPALGKGRPGWHIECSAINYSVFKKTTDIHTGGVDLIFPHHTNEIAQSQPLYYPFAKFWVHNEHLLVEGQKMAKSKNNFLTLAEILEKKFHPLAFRYLTLTAHYRTQLNFTWESLENAQNSLNSLCTEVRNLALDLYYRKRGILRGGKEEFLPPTDYEEGFEQSVNDDLNIPRALALVWEMLGDKRMSSKHKLDLVKKFDKVLGLGLVNLIKPPKINPKALKLAVKREELRNNKQFIPADRLREEINGLGYIVEDTPDGPLVLPEKSVLG